MRLNWWEFSAAFNLKQEKTKHLDVEKLKLRSLKLGNNLEEPVSVAVWLEFEM